jgi:hypothetical protein
MTRRKLNCDILCFIAELIAGKVIKCDYGIKQTMETVEEILLIIHVPGWRWSNAFFTFTAIQA